MKIKDKTHYTIKILIFLSKQKESIHIKEISQELEISFEHCRKIIQESNKLGITATLRGRNGGVYLAKTAKEIEIYPIILHTEDVDMESYEHNCNNCPMPIDCNFKRMVKDNYKKFYSSFEGITLFDLIKH